MPTPDAPPPPRPDPIAGLEAIDCRMTAAVAAADWPRFRSLLDEMLTLVADLGDPAPAPPTASPTPPPPPPIPPPHSPETRQQLRRALVAAVAARERIRQQSHRLRESIARRDGQARRAADAGRDDLARHARQRQQNARRQLAALDRQLADLEHQQRRLTQALLRVPAHPRNDTIDTVAAELAALKAASAAAAYPERKI